MQSILILLFLFLNYCCIISANATLIIDKEESITTDNRIKTYVYSPNEIFLMVLHFGYQSHIEFDKDEEIKTISTGESYSWEITPMSNMIFIKPLVKNIRTNMTVITNKRMYQFDIVSKELYNSEVEDMVYALRFYYPKKYR